MILLVRHARAGDREEWEGDDRERPLDERGRLQAEALVELLDEYAVEAVLTSPYRRCVDTVVPFSVARGLEPEARDELGEERQQTAGAALVRSLDGGDVLVCGHRGLETALLADPPKWRKGATFVLGDGLELLAELPPPR